MFKKTLIIAACLVPLAAPAQAVTLREIIRNCKADGERLCPKASYGQQMQSCLSKNFAKLSPSCKPIVTRLNRGEKVRLF